MKEHVVYLLLGSDLGDKKKQIGEAVEMIHEEIGEVIMRSSFYETEPWGFSSKEFFLNIALKLKTSLMPEEVLQKIGIIENLFGRERQGNGYSSRTLDIDILFYDELILDKIDLKIPHPLLQERRFVLVPMDEIAAGLIHPVFHKTVHELLLNCSDNKEVRMYKG